jgi:GPH family glycoside/pentoside/hexuronide:cation symporter/probable glucitol transport protein GutA
METRKLSTASKIFYGLGDLSAAFAWNFTSGYLTMFYTDMAGLGPAMVTGIFLAARILDIVSDPVFGATVDRTHTKWGRFRPYILFCSPILALFVFFTFTAPFHGNIAKITWASFTYIAMGMLYSVVILSYGSIGAVMTFNPRERHELNSWRFIGNYLGKFILGACTVPLILAFSNAGGNMTKSGFTKTALFYSAISIPLWMVFFKTSREEIKPISPKKSTLAGSFKTMFQNKPLVLIIGTLFFYYAGFSAHTSLWLYYIAYNVKRIDLIPYLSTFSVIAGIAGIYIGNSLIHKMDKKKVIIFSYAVYIFLYLGFYLNNPANIKILMIIQISGGTLAFCNPAVMALIPDCIDYAEDTFGKRSDGVAYAFSTLIMKLGMAIGPSAGLSIMAWSGYRANAIQSGESLKSINFSVNLIPAVCLVFSIVILSFYDLNQKKMKEIRQRLIKRQLNPGPFN